MIDGHPGSPFTVHPSPFTLQHPHCTSESLMRRILLPLLLLVSRASAQHPQTYVPDPDPVARQKIAEWQDLKLGLLMHWGPYAQWGTVESWSICSEDVGWCRSRQKDRSWRRRRRAAWRPCRRRA